MLSSVCDYLRFRCKRRVEPALESCGDARPRPNYSPPCSRATRSSSAHLHGLRLRHERAMSIAELAALEELDLPAVRLSVKAETRPALTEAGPTWWQSPLHPLVGVTESPGPRGTPRRTPRESSGTEARPLATGVRLPAPEIRLVGTCPDSAAIEIHLAEHDLRLRITLIRRAQVHSVRRVIGVI